MTRDEARRRAVEAAAEAWGYADSNQSDDAPDPIEIAIAAYERAMADAGWRMVRVVKEKTVPDKLKGTGFIDRDSLQRHVNGWNACRAAMLADGDAGG